MNYNRYIVQGPTDGQVWVIAVPPTSTAIDLTQPAFAPLLQKIQGSSNVPLQLYAEGATGAIYYRWSQATGIIDENALSVPTQLADRVCYAVAMNRPEVLPEFAPQKTNFLLVKVANGMPTGLLRIVPIG